MRFRSAFQINSGLGSGNIGDDMMARALWSELPRDFDLEVGVFDNYSRARQPFPSRYRYRTAAGSKIENWDNHTRSGLLAGSGCIFERPGAAWPLGFLAPRLSHFHERGLPVDAVGVTVEPVLTSEGLSLFREAFQPIRSWAVCDHSSKQVLLSLGVEAERIRLGADWIWLYTPPFDYTDWASGLWRAAGAELSRPLLAVNVFWPAHMDTGSLIAELATALDALHRHEHLQIAFFSSDFRHPGLHQSTMEAVQARMQAPALMLPNEYYSPGELIALLRHTTAVLARPYAAGYAAVLANTVPVFLASRIMGPELAIDLGLEPCGRFDQLNANEIIVAVGDACANRERLLSTLAGKRKELARRAKRNLDAVALFHGFSERANLAETVAQ